MNEYHDKHFGSFYRKVLTDLLSRNEIHSRTRILVLCGGIFDARIFSQLGFTDVTISNLNPSENDSFIAGLGYKWATLDASAITLPDSSYELAVVHSGLHHLPCPQKAITEMYRVSTAGVLAIEPAMNLFTKVGVFLGLGQEYETEAVAANGLEFGGLDNTAVPNFVYRFSRQDIVRCIQAYAPVARHKITFWTATRIQERLFTTGPFPRRFILRLASPVLRLLGNHFFAFANNMAFFISKPALPAELLPWLHFQNGSIAPKKPFFSGHTG